MTFFRSLLFVCPFVGLVAQTPPPKPAQTPPPKAAPAAQPTVTMSSETIPAPAFPAIPPDKVVISVGDEKMTFGQFEAILNSLPEQYRATAKGPGRKQYIESLMRVMVLSQEGKRRKLDEKPTYQTQLAFQRENILAAATYEDITKTLKVDEAELHKYYDAHQKDYEQVHARHILIRMKGSPVPLKPGQKELTDEEALAKAQELHKKLEGGTDFAALAMTESDDVSNAGKGGDLGFFRHGQMVPSFEQAAFAMKPGELSEPVKSQFGYHLIKVEAHESKSFDNVRGEIETLLRPQAIQKFMDDLKQKAGATFDPELLPSPAPATPAATPTAKP